MKGEGVKLRTLQTKTDGSGLGKGCARELGTPSSRLDFFLLQFPKNKNFFNIPSCPLFFFRSLLQRLWYFCLHTRPLQDKQ